jgi:HK97 family phage prohead protease
MTQQQFTEWAATVAGVDEETGEIEGVAVRYNVPIQRGSNLYEMVQPGAFAKQIADPARVSVLWQHDSDAPIGRASNLEDTAEVLRFRAKITQHADVPEARKALALLREGVIDEISVGFQWQKWSEVRDDTKVTIVHERARLRELSVVTFGALGRDARVLTVASDNQTGLQLDLIRAKFDALNS